MNMQNTINFRKDIKDYDDIIFYYAGHAFQIKDENYLAGIDLLNVTSLPDEREKIFLLKRASLLLSEVLEILRKTNRQKCILSFWMPVGFIQQMSEVEKACL